MILITGAAGLLGAELFDRLTARRLPVRGIDLHPSCLRGSVPSCLQFGDLLNAEDCKHACEGAECVVHCAARQHHNEMPRWGRDRFFHANVDMTSNLVDAANQAGVRQLVFVSSDMVYGLPPGRPFTESDEPRPIGPYGRSKLACEAICSDARRAGMCVTILRPRLLIGPGRLGVLQKLFDRVRTGRSVPVLGDGNHRYQMVAVSDVAAACERAIDCPCDETINLGSSNPPSVRALLEELCRRSGNGSSLMFLPKRAARAALWSLHAVRLSPLAPEQFRIADVDYVLDTSRARERLGWQPQLSDTDMLSSAYDTYIARLHRGEHPAACSLKPAADTP